MAPSVRRRLTPVNYAKQLLDAIVYIRSQKQIPNFDRISRHLQKNLEITPRRCKEQLNNAVSDGLIVEYTAVRNKGEGIGTEQEGYRLPNSKELEDIQDGHDWYCFECHGPGEVYKCNGCFRVYHQDCTLEDTEGETFTCSICFANSKKSKMRRKMLNTLLSYTMIHLKDQTKEIYKLGNKSQPEDLERFILKKMDLYKMEQKVQASKYKCLDEFLADARLILHNCTLLFGEEKGSLTDLASVMVKACKYDIEEIDVCTNCYYMSNAKPEDWFCQPCNPPHDLVFAKQKGYSYWPAKVVRDLGGKFDVRFFGGWHQRAIIPAEYIRPITTEVKTLNVKKTAGFTNSMKELKRHQTMLEEREKELEGVEGVEEEEEEDEEDEGEEEKEEKEFGDKTTDSEMEDSNVGKEDTELVEEQFEESDEEEKKVKNEKKKKTPKSTPKSTPKTTPKGTPKTTPKIKMTPQAKKGKKRSRVSVDNGLEEEVDNRQVSSTSVERQAKRVKRNSSKVGSQDESIQVTSSVDKILASPAPIIATMNAAVQTTIVKKESQSVQTDLETKKEDLDIEKDDFTATKSIGMDPVTEANDKYSEESMAKGIADLTKRLEEKFDEEKAKALKELSQRLEEDFGKDKQKAVERAIANMKQEVEKSRKIGEESTRAEYMEEMKKLATRHKEAIAQAKKKQWCFNCGEESMYHCCWNTSYCSHSCQQEHWHSEHKRVCRRKRPTSST